MQQEIRLYEEVEAVLANPHGEAALRRIVEATFRLWDRIILDFLAEEGDPQTIASVRRARA